MQTPHQQRSCKRTNDFHIKFFSGVPCWLGEPRMQSESCPTSNYKVPWESSKGLRHKKEGFRKHPNAIGFVLGCVGRLFLTKFWGAISPNSETKLRPPLLGSLTDPQNGKRIRYTWCSNLSWPPKMAGVPQNCRRIRYTWCSITFWPPKMAGVSDTPGVLSHFGPPKWQAYQIHLVFHPILAPQNGRRIRYTWCSITFWPPKMAGVSDTPSVPSHFGPPKWQAYQIHLVFYHILAPQNGRRIRYTWCSIPSWPPKIAGVSDTPGVLSHLGPPKMAGVSHTPGANVCGRNVGNHMLIFF